MHELTLKTNQSAKPTPDKIPAYIADGVARATLRAIERYFKDPAVIADYEKWLKENYEETE